MKNIRVLVVGCGNMGASHAKAYQNVAGFEICGLVSPGNSKEALNEALGGAKSWTATSTPPYQTPDQMRFVSPLTQIRTRPMPSPH